MAEIVEKRFLDEHGLERLWNKIKLRDKENLTKISKNIDDIQKLKDLLQVSLSEPWDSAVLKSLQNQIDALAGASGDPEAIKELLEKIEALIKRIQALEDDNIEIEMTLSELKQDVDELQKIVILGYEDAETGQITESLIDKIAKLEKEGKSIYYDTKENWQAQLSLMSEQGNFYVYSNQIEKENGDGTITYIPSIKIGDGKAYVADLPFIDEQYLEHITNEIIHVNETDKNNWNQKVSCEIDKEDNEKIIFLF